MPTRASMAHSTRVTSFFPQLAMAGLALAGQPCVAVLNVRNGRRVLDEAPSFPLAAAIPGAAGLARGASPTLISVPAPGPAPAALALAPALVPASAPALAPASVPAQAPAPAGLAPAVSPPSVAVPKFKGPPAQPVSESLPPGLMVPGNTSGAALAPAPSPAGGLPHRTFGRPVVPYMDHTSMHLDPDSQYEATWDAVGTMVRASAAAPVDDLTIDINQTITFIPPDMARRIDNVPCLELMIEQPGFKCSQDSRADTFPAPTTAPAPAPAAVAAWAPVPAVLDHR
mmetsp:Transcript_5714/g.13413  ORF Transcript_5714/g.13413 Transcript_5714/m.13413 type:complete len:285 (-) Transcript_5714:150-1004(-)